MPQVLPSFWHLPAEAVLQQLKSNLQGLSRQEAQQRLGEYGANSLKQQQSQIKPSNSRQFNQQKEMIL